MLQQLYHKLVPSGFSRQSIRKMFAAPANIDRQAQLLAAFERN